MNITNKVVKIASEYIHAAGGSDDWSNGFQVSSDSLKVAVKTAGSIGTSTANAVTADVSVDLVWGQF